MVKSDPGVPCVFVCGYWRPEFHPAYVNHPFGLIFLSDELVSNQLERFINPKCAFYNPNCKFIWRQYLHPSDSDHPKVRQLPCAYKSGFGRPGPPVGIEKRDLVWSFVGAVHGEDRRAAIEAFAPFGPNLVHETPPLSFDDQGKGLKIDKYREVYDRSRFVLAPPGRWSMECSRLYEALEAGCVPVALKNAGNVRASPSYHHRVFGVDALPFVVEDTWADAAAVVRRLEADPWAYAAVQQACVKFWAAHKDRMRKKLAEDIATLSA